MKFETLTYNVRATDYSVSYASAPAISGRLAPLQGAASDSEAISGFMGAGFMSSVMAAFLLRVAAYFQGCLPRFPSLEPIPGDAFAPAALLEPLMMADSSIDDSMGPLQRVRMNRRLSRRLRWLIKTGRVERRGDMRLATAQDKARCHLSPGQFIEHCIRVYGWSRARSYGFGLSRYALRRIAVMIACLQGDGICMRKAALCNALISPD